MAARVRIVESVFEEPNGAVDCWYVITRAPGDGGITHVFPKGIFEWRAAEYGVDPQDIGTLLDMILHEQLMDDEEGAALQRDVSAARSTAAARQAYSDRLAALKQRTRIILDGKDNPLDAIRAKPGISADGLRAKREVVDTARWLKQYGDLPVRPPSPSSLLEVPRA
jgi:hypothetical protein